MKTKSLFLKAMPLVMLVLLLVSACEEFTGPYDVYVQRTDAPKVPAPVVTTKAVTGGVLLSWPPVDAMVTGYEIRRHDGKDYVTLAPNFIGKNENGVYHFLDIVNDDTATQSLPLKPNTYYTYTVIAKPDLAIYNTTDPGIWTGGITTGVFPARTERPKAPAAVALELNPENRTAKVTITPPVDAPLPNYYIVSLTDANDIPVQDMAAVPANVADKNLYTVTEWTFTNLNLHEDVYNVNVTSVFGGYYSNSAEFITSGTAEWLFKPAGTVYVNTALGNDNKFMYRGGNTLAYYSAEIILNGISKPGVSYTIERGTIDKNGNITYYTPRLSTYRILST